MANVITWLSANWMQILVALLAIDAALIPIFPNVTLFVKIKTFLTGVTSK